MKLFTVKSNNDVIQTEGRLAKAARLERRALRKAAVLHDFHVGRRDTGDPRVFGHRIWGVTSKGPCLRMVKPVKSLS